jgi:hypothetical protein
MRIKATEFSLVLWITTASEKVILRTIRDKLKLMYLDRSSSKRGDKRYKGAVKYEPDFPKGASWFRHWTRFLKHLKISHCTTFNSWMFSYVIVVRCQILLGSHKLYQLRVRLQNLCWLTNVIEETSVFCLKVIFWYVMWCSQKLTAVSEEHTASNFRVEESLHLLFAVSI